jgi:hypothetical protein
MLALYPELNRSLNFKTMFENKVTLPVIGSNKSALFSNIFKVRPEAFVPIIEHSNLEKCGKIKYDVVKVRNYTNGYHPAPQTKPLTSLLSDEYYGQRCIERIFEEENL